MQIKARRCFVPISPSDWVAKVFLTCDNRIAVQFKHGEKVKKVLPHGPGAYLGHGGVPAVCCLYPGTQGDLAVNLYELAQVWTYSGEWVHTFLYKKFGYQLVAPPTECGNCNTSCSIQLYPASPSNGQNVTITCTVTNSDGNASKGAAPQGTVAISVDGTVISTQTLPSGNQASQNYESVSTSWTATCTPGPGHVISATFTPSETDFAGTSCTTSVLVTGCSLSCCAAGDLPNTLFVTISNVSGCGCLAGTYELTYQAGAGNWQSSSMTLCGTDNVIMVLDCLENQYVFAINGSYVDATSVSCTTPSIVFNNLVMGSLCTGTVNVTVTA